MAKIIKYIQIKEDIINHIKNGILKPGDKIESESNVKKKYNVSTITVRKAFSDLINEGYLYGVQGVGTFVAKKQMIRGLTSISFSDELVQQGYTTDMKVLQIDEIYDEVIASKLETDKEQAILKICRVRYAQNEAIAYQISYVATSLLTKEDAQQLYETKSFYQVLKNKMLYPEIATETYSIKMISDPNIADNLNLPLNEYAFFVQRYACIESNKIIEYSETYFNKDWYSVTVTIKV